ncbi:hypothetical protein PIB30_004721 [Stylosanthes scabra]|uniref:C2H2-type domain-containing protein n=1 Tax=Stylosanthes scabra TaxID=79078 RepID=A0ABU6S3J2_9FABA|nr:hypothetical protein [Stylosanthes scabra]
MSGISPLDMNQKMKEVRSKGNDDHMKPGATMSDSAKHHMPKTHQPKHAFSMNDRMGKTKTSTKPDHRHFKLDNDLMSKIMKNDPSVMENFFEKVVLQPPGGVGTGIRIIHSYATNNNIKPVRNHVDDQIHHHDDRDNDSVNVAADAYAADDGVKVAAADDAADGGKVAAGNGDGGDEAGIRSLPYKKHGPYTCPKCKVVFLTSQKFAAHIEFMNNAGGGEGSSTLHEVKVEYQPCCHNNLDAPPGFPIPLGGVKIKAEPFP